VDKPLISVIITSYNYLRYIITAIESARSQTYPDLEIVVVDNCSTDGTVPELRRRYGDDPRVRIYENAANIGELLNTNRGFELSRGDFVLWLSADDWLYPRHLERLHAPFEREPGLDVVHSGAYVADAGGRVWNMRQLVGRVPFDYVDARDELVEMFVLNHPLCWPAALFRRKIFLDVGGENPDDGLNATDWEMQIRIALAGKRFAYLQDASMAIRLHAGQATGEAYITSGSCALDFLRILEKYIEHPGFARVRGREEGIVARIDELVAQATAAGGDPFSPADRERFERMRARLRSLARAYAPARVHDERISVIVPAVRSPELTARAIASVACQTRANWEIVVVDHVPMSLEGWIAGNPVADRITYVRPPLPFVPGRARNHALRMARGTYLAFLDEDNTFAPNHLAVLSATIAGSGGSIAASCARCLLEDADAKMLDFPVLGELQVHRTADDSPDLSAVGAALPLNAVLFYRHLLDRAGQFDERLPILEDYEYLLRLEAAAPIAFAREVTLDVHVRVRLNSALGANIRQYLPVLEQIHAAHPVAPQLAARRAANRSAIADAIRTIEGPAVGLNEIGGLIAALAGRV